MIVLAAAFVIIPVAIIAWVAYVGALGLKFCWNVLFKYSAEELAENAGTQQTSEE